jgi:protein involved in ribonucleotide reduction
MIYGHELEKIGTFTRSIVQSGNNTFASTYKVQEKVYNNRIKQLLKDFEGRQ